MRKNEAIKVLALDLDGTLTNSEKKITLATKEAIHQAINEGVAIVLASGRPTIGIWPVAKELELDKLGGYILAYNGGKIIECKSGVEISSQVLDMKYFADLCSIAKQHHVASLTYDGNRIVSEDDQDPYVLKECMINRTIAHKAENLAEEINHPVPKFMFVGDHEKLVPIKSYMDEHYSKYFSIYYSEPFFLEVMPLGVEKSASLAVLLKKLHTTKEHLMACGDGLNDLTMLSYAGYGVAMENACVEAKNAADYITLSNDEDGVAAAIQEFILKNKEQVG